jgi:hypothetical protein
VSLTPRAVVVHRPTEYDELIARHGTRGQAAFFLSSRGRQIEEVESRHARQVAAVTAVTSSLPLEWRRGLVDRADLPRFLFSPEDVIIVIGQDGLVANVAKYLDGQPVVGVNPDPERNPGVLVPFAPRAAAELLHRVSDVRLLPVQARTMVQADLDDGQTLLALNEVFVGPASHQTARYTLTLADGRSERQASSGIIVSTGTGASGWCRSISLERHSEVRLPDPLEDRLAWFVREAWPSPATGTQLVEGVLDAPTSLYLAVESDRLVIFGDGIETDFVLASWGQRVQLHESAVKLRLVHQPQATRLIPTT